MQPSFASTKVEGIIMIDPESKVRSNRHKICATLFRRQILSYAVCIAQSVS